jgi:hypothetical protein
MKKLTAIALMLALGSAITVMSLATAQPPDKKGAKGTDRITDRDWSTHPIVTKMMAFNKKKDGKLTKDDVTDERLHRLFDRADKNKDGVVTKEELIALAKEIDAEWGDEGGRGPGGKGKFGKGKFGKGGPPPDDDFPPPGGPGGRGPGGFGGRGPGGPPRPGEILPPFLRDRLELTAEQKKQLDALQKEVDAKLDKILTAAQKKQLKEMREGFGPGGRGPGGRGGRGPGGPPPE